ncbi:MAG TPA: tetratricopeptide repeat protein, partial [Thermoflexia bacterium]|nr:tetratricopeptide repeat protein [Thermoflexia bacterium]
LSGDDALAWLQSLTVGKEEELRAQAEVEQQARVDEIMGRKRPAPPAAPPAEEAPAEVVVAPTEEEGLLSGDDALAWLQSLTVGKEEELRAQAEVEQQARVDEIMGRKRPAPPAAPVVEEAPPAPPAEEAPAETAPAGAEIVVAEIVTPAAPTEAEQQARVDESMGRKRPAARPVELTEEEELRAQAEAEQQARIDAIMGRKRPARPAEKRAMASAEVSAAEKRDKLFGWSSFDTADQITKETLEPEMPEEELVPSFGFTRFKDDKKTVAPKLSRIEERASDVVAEPPAIVSPKPRKRVPSSVSEVERPRRGTKPQPVVQEAVVKTAPEEKRKEITVPVFDLAERKSYVEANETDYQSRLELAQALWVRTERKESLQHYEELLQHADELLDNVVSDLQIYTQKNPDESQSLQLLGDAYMKQGSPQKALEAYRQAIASL